MTDPQTSPQDKPSAEGARAPLDALVTVQWGDSVVATRHLREGERATVGASPDAVSPLPCDAIGAPCVTVALVRGGAPIAFVPRGSLAFRERAQRPASGPLRDPARDLPAPHAGPAEIALAAGETLSYAIGRFQITIAAEARDRAPFAGIAPLGTSLSPLRHVGIAALAHALLIGLSAQAAHARSFEESGPDTEALGRYLAASEQASRTADPVESALGEGAMGRDVNAADGNGKDGGGRRAQGKEGSMGTPASRAGSGARFGVSGKAAPSKDVQAEREAALDQARDFGLAALLRDGAVAPTSTFGDRPSAVDPFASRGAMWGFEVGEAYGAGGLGLSGVGEGGGGRAEGSIGLGEIGTLGHTFGRAGTGTGGSGVPGLGIGGIGWGGGCGCDVGLIGHGIGTLGRGGDSMGSNDPSIPRLRPAKVEDDGEARLPAETIRRVVRQAAGRFRACYQGALLANPSLSGGVTTRFLIGAGGQVRSAQNLSADLPDKAVVACVTRVFSTLSFPEPPDGRTVTVTYPMTFAPTP